MATTMHAIKIAAVARIILVALLTLPTISLGFIISSSIIINIDTLPPRGCILPSQARHQHLSSCGMESSSSSHHHHRRRTVMKKLSLFWTTLVFWTSTTPSYFVRALGSSSSADAATESSSSSCPQQQKIFVVGANGKTGFRVVEMLHKDPRYRPTAMIRTKEQATRFETLGIEWAVGDLEMGQPSPTIMEGADAVIFAAGAGRSRSNVKKVSIDYIGAIKTIVSAQETTSVKRFLLLSGINTDPLGTRRSVHSKNLDGPLAPWHRLKAHSETYLKESHLHGRPLDWTILCPGRLVDDDDDGNDNNNNNDDNNDSEDKEQQNNDKNNGKGGHKKHKIKISLIHGEEDLKQILTKEERAVAVKVLPGSHDGKSERLCVSRDNTAATLLALLDAPRTTIGKSLTLVDGLLSVEDALKSL